MNEEMKASILDVGAAKPQISIGELFFEFLTIGATSFGGAVPYLRGSLVTKRAWLGDKEFVELLSISQSLPGLNATNMSILVGQKMRVGWGAAAAVLGICLPASLLMFVVGIVYRSHGDHAWATGALKGVAAASVGLVLSTVVQLSKRSLGDRADYLFVILTVLAVNRLHLSVLITLVVVGLLAILLASPAGMFQSKGRCHESTAYPCAGFCLPVVAYGGRRHGRISGVENPFGRRPRVADRSSIGALVQRRAAYPELTP